MGGLALVRIRPVPELGLAGKEVFHSGGVWEVIWSHEIVLFFCGEG